LNTTKKLIVEWNDIEREKREFIENWAAPRKLASDKIHEGGKMKCSPEIGQVIKFERNGEHRNGKKKEIHITIQGKGSIRSYKRGHSFISNDLKEVLKIPCLIVSMERTISYILYPIYFRFSFNQFFLPTSIQ